MPSRSRTSNQHQPIKVPRTKKRAAGASGGPRGSEPRKPKTFYGKAIGHITRSGNVIQSLPRTRVDLSQFFLSELIRHYQQTGNGGFAWSAYAAARRWGCTIPEEILTYLDECARAISESNPSSVMQCMKLRGAKGGSGYLKTVESLQLQLERLHELDAYYFLLKHANGGGLFKTKKQAREWAAKALREKPEHATITAESLRVLHDLWVKKKGRLSVL